jgi:hypothetical protein
MHVGRQNMEFIDHLHHLYVPIYTNIYKIMTILTNE